jgi:hypothetical protein
MPLMLKTLFIIIACLIFLGLVLKFIVLKSGRSIKSNFISFFWFSRLQIVNSTYDFSKKKRLVMNQITLIILILLAVEILIGMAYLWIYL